MKDVTKYLAIMLIIVMFYNLINQYEIGLAYRDAIQNITQQLKSLNAKCRG